MNTSNKDIQVPSKKRQYITVFYVLLLQANAWANHSNKEINPLQSWFVGLGIGAQQLNVENPILIYNHNITSYQYLQYITQTDAQVILSAELGRRFTSPISWKKKHMEIWPNYRLSFYYNHLFTTNIGDRIQQHPDSTHTNTQYNWNASADVMLALAQFDLIKINRFTPFVQVGLGLSLNESNRYLEKIMPDDNPYPNPSFNAQTLAQFAYNIGAGIDWAVSTQWHLAALYQFQDLGKLSSGFGINAWKNTQLSSRIYQSNAAIMKAQYIF